MNSDDMRSRRGSGGLPLTERQEEILHLVQAGKSNKEVANLLGITEGTVKQHLVAIYRQLKVNNRTKAARLIEQARGEVSLFSSQQAPTGGTAPSVQERRGLSYSSSLQPVSLLVVRLPSSDALLHRLGSEGFARLQMQLKRIVETVARRFEGVVQGFPGGVLVLFGVPHMREDDPERAACAACLVRRELIRLGGNESGDEFPWQLGVASGRCVATTDAQGRIALQGDLLTEGCFAFPAWMQGGDRQGLSMVTDQALRWLVSRYGALSTWIPETSCAGLRTRPGGIRAILEGELLGRREEMEALGKAWQEAQAGRSGMSLVLGEAGFGKTRLIRELQRELLAGGKVTWLEGSFRAVTRHRPFHAFPGVLESLAGCRREFSHAERVALVESTFGVETPGLTDLMTLMAGEEAFPAENGAIRVERIAAMLVRHLQRLEGPVVLFLDNLQWMDGWSSQLLPHLAELLNGTRVWLIGAGRGAELRTLAATPGIGVVALRRLMTREIVRLLEDIAGKPRPDKELTEQIAQWSGGVPLFAVETWRSIAAGQEAGGEPGELIFPETLLGLILERVDRVGVDWRVARAVAAYGRVSLGQLQKLGLHVDLAQTEGALEHLVRVGLVESNGFASRREFAFVNAMVRAAIRQTLPEGDRVPFVRQM
ncbi:MAG: AAA family ATPase [Magnetococcales bacterium]|nr:AAA family ATPase [Magnetococcales bacterium]